MPKKPLSVAELKKRQQQKQYDAMMAEKHGKDAASAANKAKVGK